MLESSKIQNQKKGDNMAKIRDIIRECVEDVHKLTHQPKYLNDRDARAQFASQIGLKLEQVWHALDKIEHVLENIEHNI